MRLIFLLENDYKDKYLAGMKNKIALQKEIFESNGIECTMHVLDKGKFQYCFAAKILKRLPFTNISPRWSYSSELSQCDWVYFRRPYFINVYTLLTLRKIKKGNNNVRIMMEIPTYPYDGEYKKVDFPLKIKDMFCRRCLRRYVDKLAVVGIDKYLPHSLWGIDVIAFENGISVHKVRVRIRKKDEKTIKLIAISSMASWHGYERVINGLIEYYRNGAESDVHIYFIGEGHEKKYYEKLSSNEFVKEKIHFLGFLSGAKLEDAINQYGDLGLCSFGRYKTHMPNSTDLKSIEYLARGIPIVTGAPLDIIEANEFCLEFDNNSSYIDIGRVVEFYQQMLSKFSTERLASMVREYAEENCDISSTMQPIIDALWS